MIPQKPGQIFLRLAYSLDYRTYPFHLGLWFAAGCTMEIITVKDSHMVLEVSFGIFTSFKYVNDMQKWEPPSL